MCTPVKVACAIALFVLTIATTTVQPSHASGLWYVAATGSDNNDCATPATPCAGINGALNKPGFVAGDTIRVAVGTYSGTGAVGVQLNKSVIILGGWDSAFTAQIDASTLDGIGRGLTVDLGVVATVEHFVIQNSDSFNGGGGVYNSGTLTLRHNLIRNNIGMEEGGGIYNAGTLTLIESAVSGNIGTYWGGGIMNAAGGVMVISNSSITNNNPSVFSSSTGGGIYNAGTLTINNSTISGNISYSAGGIYSDGTLTLNSVTVSANTSISSPGGGIRVNGDNMTLRNSILAGNSAGVIDGHDCSASVIVFSGGYNLIEDPYGCTIALATGDLTYVDPKLEPLTGSPGYHPLVASSPAINAGNPNGCLGSSGLLSADQRGVPRSGRCDIGAYEASSFATMKAIGTFMQGSSVAYQIILNNDTGNNLSNLSIANSVPVSLTYTTGSLTATSGIVTVTNSAIQWTGALAANAVVTLSYTAVVSPNIPSCTFIFNTATINGPGFGFDIEAQGTVPCVCNLAKAVGIPVLSVGPLGSWDQSLVYDPTILKDSDQYKMWYSGSSGTSTRIGYATSPDGLTWTKHGSNPVLAPSLPWESSRIFGPTVISDTGIYKMWYAGSDGTTTRIGYATSPDGITWAKHGSPVFDVGLSGSWDDATVSRPSVMKIGSTYHLWYTGNDGITMRIGHATSSDGVNWSRDSANPALDLGAPGAWDWIDTYAPSVVAYGDTYLMWYSGSTLPSAYQTGLATLSNPNNNTWSKQPGLIAQGAPGSFDSNSADYPAVILEGNQFKIWYSGLNNSGTYNIGYATAKLCSAVPPPAPGSNRAYLPLIFKSMPPTPTCAAYYADNFSNANSGWYVDDNSSRRYAYLNGEYQIWAKNPNEAWFETPGAKATDFTASVSSHRTGGTSGAYGLLFGINEDWNQFYEVLIDASQFSVWRYDDGWTTLQDWTTSAAIATGTNWNRLKVVRNGSLIMVYINGQQVANLNDGTFVGLRRIGLAAESDATAVDVRFDDFALYPATCGSQVYGLALATPFDLGRPEIHTGPVTPRQRTRR